jgi:hypothetical protein
MSLFSPRRAVIAPRRAWRTEKTAATRTGRRDGEVRQLCDHEAFARFGSSVWSSRPAPKCVHLMTPLCRRLPPPCSHLPHPLHTASTSAPRESTTMFRLARIARSAPLAARMAMVVPRAPAMLVHAHAALAPGVRYNSSTRSPAAEQPKLSRQERRARYADLHTALRDHQAPVITYEQLKPKTDAPDPVRPLLSLL